MSANLRQHFKYCAHNLNGSQMIESTAYCNHKL
jgi:hypothetical protein